MLAQGLRRMLIGHDSKHFSEYPTVKSDDLNQQVPLDSSNEPITARQFLNSSSKLFYLCLAELSKNLKQSRPALLAK